MLVSGFLVLILVGGLLLKLPISTKVPVSWIDAYFTAVSAATVTGLWVVDTASTYTLFGQIVILFLIQVGGLGIMTLAILIFVIIGKRIGLKERILIQEQFQTPLGGIIRLAKRVFLFVLVIELLGTFLLAVRWVPQMGFSKGVYYSLFHIIAAFNNAGFSLWEDSLIRFVGDPVVNLVITLMIMIGGIGFTVLNDLWTKKTFHSLMLHTKLMLIGTVIINVVAVLVIYLLEYDNPKTFGKLTQPEQWWAAYFQAITARTAGFNTVPIGSLDESTLLFLMLLMFIGAGSISTAGGIKLTTFIILLFAVITFLRRNKEEAVLFERTIHPIVVYRALAVFFTSSLFVFLAVFLLTLTEPQIPLIRLAFEAVSAFGTVGLSTGITGSLSVIGKLIIMAMMFLGLVGPLTILLSIARPSRAKIRYPSENVFTG